MRLGRALLPMRKSCKLGNPTCDLGSEGAAGDMLVVVLDQNAVVPWQGGQVGHCACPVFVVNTADLCF